MSRSDPVSYFLPPRVPLRLYEDGDDDGDDDVVDAEDELYPPEESEYFLL